MYSRIAIVALTALATLLTACSADAPPGAPGSLTARLDGKVTSYAGIVSRH